MGPLRGVANDPNMSSAPSSSAVSLALARIARREGGAANPRRRGRTASTQSVTRTWTTGGAQRAAEYASASIQAMPEVFLDVAAQKPWALNDASVAMLSDSVVAESVLRKQPTTLDLSGRSR